MHRLRASAPLRRRHAYRLREADALRQALRDSSTQDTLEFSALTGVRPIVQEVPLEKANEGYKLMMDNKARFRVVLTRTK